jgi:sortase A
MSRLFPLERPSTAILLCVLCIALQQLGSAGLIHAKAVLAPLLIDSAWQRTLQQVGTRQRPWPWADTWPVGRLQVPAHGIELFILDGDTGNALAFGPGHARASAPLGSGGMAVVGGHRDTHFSFLRQLQDGDRLRLQLPDGDWRNYRVARSSVVDSRHRFLYAVEDSEQLLLVTCYPFDTLVAGGPLRFVVEALPS